jgi:peptidoglycan/LPS O-acetylase OafA/YrhL
MRGPTVNRESGELTYQPALDGLRALAVAAVIAYHLGAGWARGGFLGVDAFFVLSGFLITSLLLAEWGRHGGISLPRFWVRRARRLLPALFVVLGAIALYAATLAPSHQLRTLRADGLASVFYFANWHFVLSGQSYFDLFTLPSPMRHLWSLAIEEQFYLVWPLVVLGCLWIGRGSRKPLAAVCVAGIAGSVAVMAILYEPLDPSRAYYGTDARAHTLLVGAVLALLLARRGARNEPGVGTGRRARRDRGVPVALHVVGIVAAAGMVLAWSQVSDQGSGLYRGGSLVFSIAVAMVIASAVQPGRSPLRVALSLPVLCWLGRISYGLYLWHWPAIVVLTEDRTGLSGGTLTVARLATTLGAATLSFYLVEQPIRRGALRGWRGRVAVPTGFAAAAVVVVVATVGATAASPLEQVQAGQKLRGQPAPTAAGRQAAASAQGGASAQPGRILLVGDSVPYTLLPGLQPLGSEHGVSVDTALVAGCGVVGGTATYYDGQIPPHAPGCEKLVDDYEQSALDRDLPDVVIWMSTWEINDRIVQGERVRFGNSAWDEMMLDKIDQAARRLTVGGAHLVITTMAPRAPNELVPPSDTAETSRYVRLNQLYTQYARAHPESVSVVDFAGMLCPGGPPCSRTVDGIEPRPLDGLHFTPKTAGWAADRLLDAVLACRRTTTGWVCPEQEPAGRGGQAARK